MNDIDSTVGISNGAGAVTRRRALGVAGAGLMTAGLVRLAGAQTTTGTPEASPETTPSTGTSGTAAQATNDTAALIDAAIQHATDAITSVTADRDAVASEIQPQTTDAVLDQATTAHDAAREAAGSDDARAFRLAHAAIATALSARRLIIAQLTYAGLPSQEAAASRTLARAHELISAISDETGGASELDTAFYVTTAQELYATAYDDYSNSAYARAAATAKAAVTLVQVPWTVNDIGEGHRGLPGFPSRPGRDVIPGMDREGGIHISGTGRGRDVAPGTEPDEPVTVPAPDF